MLLRGGAQPEPVDVRVRDGLVVEVGPRLESEPDERVVDLGGRVVRRGLRDAHVHFAQWARARRHLDVSAARSPAEAAALVARAAGRSTSAPVLLEGGGFRDSLWTEAPSAELLTSAAPGRAVVLHSLDRHSAWLSRPALALVGLAEHPTGLLREHEAWDALRRLPAPTHADDDAVARDAVAAAHARGVTSIVDFDFEDAHAAWHRRQHEGADGRLGLRVTAVVLPHHLASHVAAGRRTGSGDAWLRVGPVKLFADGSLGSRTARCLHPYGGTGDRGRRLLDRDGLHAAVTQARASGFTVAVHAIGDEVNRDVLETLRELSVRDASIEHAQLLRREDMPLFRTAGVTASIQPAHLLDDRDLVDALWSGSSSVPYAFRSLLDAGARVALGSDAPVSPLDPWRGLAAAVHRTDGRREPWHPEEAVTLEEAVEASGARRPRPGDAADLVVVDLRRLPRDAADLAEVPVHAVMLGGRWVHGEWAEAEPAWR